MVKTKRGLVTLISLISSAVISVNSLNGCFYSEQTRLSERAERVRDTSSIYLVKPEIAQISFGRSYNIYIRKDGGLLEVLYGATYVDCRMAGEKREKKLQYWFVHREGSKSYLIKMDKDLIYRIEEAGRR